MVHAAVVLLAWHMKLVLPRVAALPVLTMLRLLPERTDRADPRSGDSRSPSGTPPARRGALQSTPITPPPPPVPPAPDLARPNQAPSQGAIAPAAGDRSGRVALDGSDPAPAGSAASGALVLTPSREVLRGALANPAVMDPRSNTPTPTFEERMAMGMNPDLCLKVERMPDGTQRRSLMRSVELPSTLQAEHGHKTALVRVCP
jgi:hypothetical protein